MADGPVVSWLAYEKTLPEETLLRAIRQLQREVQEFAERRGVELEDSWTLKIRHVNDDGFDCPEDVSTQLRVALSRDTKKENSNAARRSTAGDEVSDRREQGGNDHLPGG